jgi:signal transduction histidine kinase
MMIDRDPVDRLSERVRQRVLVSLLRSFSVGACLIAGVTTIQAAREGVLSPTLMVGAGAAAGLLVLLRLRHYLHYRVTAQLFIAQVWLIATYQQSFHGLSPSTALGIAAFMLIAAMFLGLRAMGWILILTLLSLLGSALLVMSGSVEPWSELLWDPRQPLVWLRYLAILLFLGGGLALSFAHLVRGLQRAALRATRLVARQRAEQRRREQCEDALEQTRRHEALARFAGGLAHEFSDSLVAILALSHRIESDPRSPPHITTMAANIRLSVEGAAETAHGLLALSRSDVSAPRRIELASLLDSCVSSLRRLFPSGVALTVDSKTSETVFVDPHHFEQAILNLALNARDAIADQGSFDISVQCERVDEVPPGWKATNGTFVVISCSDTGPGIGREDLRRVFEPFYTSKPPQRGKGLGLAIVRGFIYDARGFVVVDSELGRGTTFRLFLPRALSNPAPLLV